MSKKQPDWMKGFEITWNSQKNQFGPPITNKSLKYIVHYAVGKDVRKCAFDDKTKANRAMTVLLRNGHASWIKEEEE